MKQAEPNTSPSGRLPKSLLTYTISVLIATKNRHEDLEICVQSVLRQTILPQELIIVDQNLGEESRLRVKAQMANASPEVHQTTELRYVHDASISGASEARNQGMEVASGSIWVFLDDDVELEPDFLREILAAYDGEPELAGVSGTITNYRSPSWPYRAWDSIFFLGPFHDERQPIYWHSDQLREKVPVHVTKFTGAAMSFRAELIRGIRFHTGLGGVTAGEDVEFCARLPRGARLVIAPRARLVHKQSVVARKPEHFLKRLVHTAHFLYWRHWRTGMGNRLCFVWLNVGVGLAASFACLRRLSLAPWASVIEGMREAAGLKPPSKRRETRP